MDSFSLSLLQLSTYRGKNNVSSSDLKNQISQQNWRKNHKFDFKIEESPFLLDRKSKHHKKSENFSQNQTNQENSAFTELLTTVKRNTAKLISILNFFYEILIQKPKKGIISNEENTSDRENNVLHLAKYFIILFLIGMVIYVILVFVWISFGMVKI